MAKKSKGDAEEGEEGAKKKKKPIVPIVVVLLGLFAAKTFLLKPAAQTPAQIKAAEIAKDLELHNKCAEANDLPTTDMSTGKNPTDVPTTKGAAASSHAVTVQLISTHGGEVKLAAEGGGAAPAVEGMGPVLSLDSVTVNLVDGHYLKLGLALQLDVGGDATAAKDQGLGAKALDMALSKLQRHTMTQLVAPSTRDKIKQQLGFDTCVAYKGAVLSVYFTEFVMQ